MRVCVHVASSSKCARVFLFLSSFSVCLFFCFVCTAPLLLLLFVVVVEMSVSCPLPKCLCKVVKQRCVAMGGGVVLHIKQTRMLGKRSGEGEKGRRRFGSQESKQILGLLAVEGE